MPALNLLMIGAGFTANWGAPIAADLQGMLLARVGHRQDLHALVLQHANFESALGVARQRALQGGAFQQDLAVLEQAVADVFQSINLRCIGAGPLNEWSSHPADSLDEFLARFDAIYSLNQDLLLECRYGCGPTSNTRWPGGWHQPGIAAPPGWHEGPATDRLTTVLTPGDFQLLEGSQPFMKLHGSTNWRSATAAGVMIVGEGKEAAIGGVPLLKRYFEQFERDLHASASKVVVIGYSFNDRHIDASLDSARQKAGLRLYLVNPAGLETLCYLKPENLGNRMRALATCVQGVCQRRLPEIFGGAAFWRHELERFLDPLSASQPP